MQHRLLAVVLGLALWAVTSPVRAETRVAVLPFTGPQAAGVRRAVLKDLVRAKVAIVADANVVRTAKRHGIRLDEARGRQTLARELRIAAWVAGRVVRRGGKLHVEIEVEEARGNTPVGNSEVSRKQPKQLEAAIRGIGPRIAIWVEDLSPPDRDSSPRSPAKRAMNGVPSEPQIPSTAGATADGSLAAAAHDTKAATPPPTTPSVWAAPGELGTTGDPNAQQAQSVPPASPPGMPSFDLALLQERRVDGGHPEPEDEDEAERTFSALELVGGVGVLNRSLSYRNPSSRRRSIGSYTLPAAPVADVAVRVYPAAFATTRWPAQLGIDLRGQLAFAVESKSADGARYDTSYRALSGSLIGRYPIRRHELHAAVGFGQQWFRLRNAQGQEAPAPDVDYRAARAGVGARVVLANWLALGFDATYLRLLSVGELADDAWFPHVTGMGVEGQLFADAHLGGPVDVRLYGTYQHQLLDTRSKSTDERVASGAADTYLTAGLALGVRY